MADRLIPIIINKLSARNSMRLFLILSIILLLPFVFSGLKKVYVILALLSINSLAAFLKSRLLLSTYLSKSDTIRHVSRSIEFTTLSMVVSGFLLGPLMGLFAGAFGIVSTYVFEKRFSKFAVVTIPLYSCLGYASGLFVHSSISDVGIAVTVAYNIVLNLFLYFIYRARPFKMISFSILNILFNLYLFRSFAPFLMGIA